MAYNIPESFVDAIWYRYIDPLALRFQLSEEVCSRTYDNIEAQAVEFGPRAAVDYARWIASNSD